MCAVRSVAWVFGKKSDETKRHDDVIIQCVPAYEISRERSLLCTAPFLSPDPTLQTYHSDPISWVFLDRQGPTQPSYRSFYLYFIPPPKTSHQD
jgi:hypothetical protein